MRIQVIKYQIKYGDKHDDITFSTLSSPRSLDEFDINIIDLSDPDIWRSQTSQTSIVNCINDFLSLVHMIENKCTTKILYLFPQNIRFQSRCSSQSNSYIILKDMLDDFKVILSYVFPDQITVPEIYYENTRTQIGDNVVVADFYFMRCRNNLTSSIKSNKTTTVQLDDDFFATTLCFQNHHDLLVEFIHSIILPESKSNVPEWMNGIVFWDDEKQREIIVANQKNIQQANLQIIQANSKLDQNAIYKSVLYTTGDELVNVIFIMLEKLLNCDLSSFKDKKTEDFLIKKETQTFIGEIKGVTSNVKNEHISQIDVHYQTYLDKLEEDGLTENVYQLLILNPFRKKPLQEREPIHENQIKLARRNHCLIIETATLLRIYERFLEQKVTSEQCIEVFSKQTGLLSLEMFN